MTWSPAFKKLCAGCAPVFARDLFCFLAGGGALEPVGRSAGSVREISTGNYYQHEIQGQNPDPKKTRIRKNSILSGIHGVSQVGLFL
jgi:hypothetical protein